MLEKPDLPEEAIRDCLLSAYGLEALELDFLPLGADVHTAVYRAAAIDGRAYFVKLRRGVLDETNLALTSYLSQQGASEVIAALATQNGRLWAEVDPFRLVLYPFVTGRDGYQAALSAAQWRTFGAALRRIHDLRLPPALAARIPSESYTPRYREQVFSYLQRVESERQREPVAARLAQFLRARRSEIADLVQRAGELAQALQSREEPAQKVLCHADLHAGNLLLSDAGALYLVDWDDPVLALKERDLMFIGGAQGFRGSTYQEEERLFYQGYGAVEVDTLALAYYRYERIIQDIAAYCEQLLDDEGGGEDREQGLKYLMSNFQAGNTIEAARRVDADRRAGR